MFRDKLDSSFRKVSELTPKSITESKSPFVDEIWQYANFKQIKDLIIKLQADIDERNNKALDDIVQNKDVKKNREFINQNKIYQANLRKLSEFIYPLASLGHLLAEALYYFIKTMIVIDKSQDFEDVAPKLISRVKANQKLYSDVDRKISDFDLTPLLLEGKLLSFYEHLSDLCEFTHSALFKSYMRIMDESPVKIDEKSYLKNAEIFIGYYFHLDKLATAKGMDFPEMLEPLSRRFGLDLSRDTVKKMRTLLPAAIRELDPKTEDARMVCMILDGTLNTFAEKFIATFNEYLKYAKLTEPLYKSGKEAKGTKETKGEVKHDASSSRLFTVPAATAPKPSMMEGLKKNFSEFKRWFG